MLSKSKFSELLRNKIYLLDGAMGTMIQAHNLEEEDYKGERFEGHKVELKGNNDLLTLTKPELIEEIHCAFLKAGSDIIETNTFNSNAISQSDYSLEHVTYELNLEGAKLAKKAVEKKITKIYFDRGIYKYHGRVKAFAEILRKNGMEF